MNNKKNTLHTCLDCQLPKSTHLNNWLSEFIDLILPFKKSTTLKMFNDKHGSSLISKFFVFFKLAHWEENFPLSVVQERTHSFIKIVRKSKYKIQLLKSKSNWTSHFRIIGEGREVYFDGLPIPRFAQTFDETVFDDKNLGKKILAKNNFPVLPGKSFYFWQQKNAIAYAHQLGFPLVVKPCKGSVARHVTTNIKTISELKTAIKHAINYSPTFLIEKFFPNAFVHRITIIDREKIFIAKQIPANIIGDGISKISELIRNKNEQLSKSTDRFHQLIIFDKNAQQKLQEQKLTEHSIPTKNQTVFLQEDPFMRLGGEFISINQEINPENLQLFSNLAKTFDLKIMGIDFISPDIKISYKKNGGAILEINSFPCIEIHELAKNSSTKNLGQEIFTLFKKYYL